jgi:hypothetical protein
MQLNRLCLHERNPKKSAEDRIATHVNKKKKMMDKLPLTQEPKFH